MKFIEIGHTKKTYGVEGDIRITIYDSFVKYLDHLTFVFIKMDGIPVPWKIEKIRQVAGLCFKFTGIDSPESAHILTGKPIFSASVDLPKSISTEPIKNNLRFGEFVGFSVLVVGESSVAIGKISDIQEYPNQEMAYIEMESGAAKLIPMVDEYIDRIDKVGKEIYLQLPEGLLDLD